MKKIYSLLKMGLKNPRYYIESINLSWKYIHLLALLGISVMAASGTYRITPLVTDLGQDLQNAIEYLPDYNIEDGQLELVGDQKALYYSSNTFQLIIDDKLEVENNQIALKQNQKEIFDRNSLFGLYLVRNNAFAILNGQAQEVPSFDYIFANPHRLSLFLNFYTDNFFRVITIIFITLMIGFFFSYWFQIILIGSLASLFNARLTRPISFSSRVKLSVMASFVPLVLLQLTSLLIPGFNANYLILAAITLFIIYKTFMNHTLFIRQIMNSLDEDQIEQLKDDTKKTDKNDDSQSKDDK